MAGKQDMKLAIDGGAKTLQGWPKRHLYGEAEKKAVMRLFDRSIATGEAFGYNGTEEDSYCREFAKFLGGGYADGVNSGSSAIYIALRALKIKAFSEVLCGPISDPGGIMPIALAGCIPIPVDSEPGSFNMSPKSFEKRLTRRAGAVIVAHIAGIPAEMEPILDIARAKGLPVIEDCAQAHGARYKGKLVGSLGDAGAFSTMSGKHHATGGQGGIVFTKSEDIYWRIRRCADRGKPFNLTGANGNVLAAHNMNMTELAACIGRVQLKKLPGIIAARQRSARWLIEACRNELKTVRIVDAPKHAESVFWFLLAQLNLKKLSVDKATFVKALAAEGAPCNTSYLHLFIDHDWYRNRQVFEGSQYPWDSPLYKGNSGATFPMSNIRATDKYTFAISWHEKVTISVARKILQALKKVEAAYR